MKNTLQSNFAQDIYAYIELRLSLGYDNESCTRRLYAFDSFCAEYHPETAVLTQVIAESWCTIKPNEKVITLKIRANVLRGFAKYLNSIGKHAHIIPDGFVGKIHEFTPYLYTKNELVTFFAAADRLPPHPLSPRREYILPVLFRVLYCCGLRPQEGRLLKRSDVNLEDGTIYIANSKRCKDRIVPMSDDLSELCKRYDMIVQKYLPEREYFFQNVNGTPYSAAWIQDQFFRCWKHAGVLFEQGNRPRVYDWRHNFATRVITNWMNEGKDSSLLLPYLSTYMGHTSLEYTAYYIHLVPEHLYLPNLTEWDCKCEVPSYED